MPDKLWAGRAAKDVDEVAAKLNASIGFDSRMYFEDIEGSMAHAAMLGAKGIISREDMDAILEGLGKILDDIGQIALQDPAEGVQRVGRNGISRFPAGTEG